MKWFDILRFNQRVTLAMNLSGKFIHSPLMGGSYVGYEHFPLEKRALKVLDEQSFLDPPDAYKQLFIQRIQQHLNAKGKHSSERNEEEKRDAKWTKIHRSGNTLASGISRLREMFASGEVAQHFGKGIGIAASHPEVVVYDDTERKCLYVVANIYIVN